MRPDVTDEQLKNRVEEFYLYRRGDELVMDQTIANMARLGFQADVIEEQRIKKEASLPVPKRITSPTWQPSALSQQQMQQLQ